MLCSSHLLSSGPQKCTACIKEDLFEEPVSILKQGGVSTFSFIHYHVNLIIMVHIFSLYIAVRSTVWPGLIFLSCRLKKSNGGKIPAHIIGVVVEPTQHIHLRWLC